MNLVPLKLITMVADDALEERLVRELKAAGATGYTVSKARGEGTHRVRTSEWEGENIRLEALVGSGVAERIAARLADRYLSKYSIVFYCSTVEVLRPEKFQTDDPHSD